MDTSKSSPLPAVSAVICTRNRGDSVVSTLETVLANTHPNFEVILVDQSTNRETQYAIERFRQDSRLTYIGTSTKGLGRARNIGIAHASSDIIAFTDDDCTVAPTWLESIAQTFEHNPRVGVVFCNVAAAPHDQTQGFIPAYQRHKSAIIRSLVEKCRARGIGAGIALRRTMLQRIGCFDENLGAGALFSSCEDGDIAVRAILNHWWIYETHEVTVLHYGFRTWHEGKELTKRDWFGIGAAYSKPLKRGRFGILVVICYEALIIGFFQPLTKLFHFQKPQGLLRIVYFAHGFIKGFCTPVDHQMRFVVPSSLNGKVEQ